MNVTLGGSWAARARRGALAAAVVAVLAGVVPAWAGTDPPPGLPPLPTVPPVTAPATARAQDVVATGRTVAAAAPLGDPCPVDSWVAGTTELCDGVLVYRDYVHDDHGRDEHQVQPRFDAHGALPPAGDMRYPPGDGNTADLVALRLRLAGDRLHVEFELNTLFRPDSTVAVLAIDTDDDESTGSPLLDVSASARGIDAVYRLTTGDPATNVMAGEVPRPPGSRWRLRALVAQADGTVMNVAFRGPHEYGFWWEERQAAALAAGDVTELSHTVDVADLEGGVTRRASVGPGAYERVYVSDHTAPPHEGVVDGDNGGNRFGQVVSFPGRYQPYGVYVPDRPAPHGVLLMLHGLEENHSGRIWFPQHGYAAARRQFGDEPNRIVAAPLARGWAGWYSGLSERDVLDVLADVEATYPVDRTKVVLGGVSMGGYGTFRLAALHPDRFAGAMTFVGYTGDCFNGTPMAGECASIGARENALELARNLRWVPIGMSFAAGDELVWANHAVAARERFQELGYPHEWWFHPSAGHTTQVVLDEWGKESGWSKDLTLVADPHRVTYRTSPALDDPELGLVHDHAYWVSAIRGRGDGWVDVDVASFGCGGREPVTEATTGAGARYVPWVSQGLAVKEWKALPADDRLEATLANVASFSVDSGRACVKGGPVAYEVTTDGPATVSLSDGRALHLAGAGTHEGVLPALASVQAAGAGGGAPGAPMQAGRELAATGGALPAAAAAGLAAVAVALATGAARRAAGRRPACARPGTRT